MKTQKLALGMTLVACSITALVLAGGGAGAASRGAQPKAQLALQRLQADFHGAATTGDYELMRSLWADDAVVSAGGRMHYGPTEIADFFSSGPSWGKAASLAPTYKTIHEIHGNKAFLRFECVIVRTGDLDPTTNSLSTIPFGAQNPEVEIVQHSTAACMAVLEDGRWVLQMFVGSAGPRS